jgi:hypothetical protein
VKGGDDVGLDEVFRAMDAAVHMAFGGKIDDGARLVFGEKASDQGWIAYVALHENMAAITVETLQVLDIACVGELVEVNDWLIRLSDPVQNEVAADKPGTASDK